MHIWCNDVCKTHITWNILLSLFTVYYYHYYYFCYLHYYVILNYFCYATKVVYEYIEKGNELDAMDHNYRIKKWLAFLACSLSSIIAILLIFLGTGYTVLFKNYEFNSKIVIAGGCFFFPVCIWIWYVFCPCGQLYRDRLSIMERRLKRDLENR